MGHRVEVKRVYAFPVSTDVIKFCVEWDFTDYFLVG